MTTLLLVLAVPTYAYAWRIVFRSWYEDIKPLGLGDLVFGALMATFFASLGGPFIAAYGLLQMMAERQGVRDGSERVARRLAGESAKAKRERLARERVERERYIEHLEREVGL